MRGILWSATVVGLATTAIVAVTLGSRAAAETIIVQEISSDPYTNVSSQHQTEVEPDTFSFGNTVVATFQVGRFEDGGGSSNIGWATSTDRGTTWTHGFLPSLTVYSTPAGPSGRASDPSVGYDVQHGVWLISALTCATAPNTCFTAPISVVVSRSADGTNWSAPITLSTGSLDKNWTACDNGASSPFYGRCYTSWIDDAGGLTYTSASTDGGVTWGSPVSAAGMVGVQPVVQPGGTLIIVGMAGSNVKAVRSTNGGASFGAAVTVAVAQSHSPSGMRAPVLPSVALDGAGTVYVVWPDCRFRASCSSNDIVMTTSADGITWPAPLRVPIDSTSSGVDHFIPGVDIDPSTAGASANIGIAYYYFPIASCSPSACQLNVGFISSTTGGASWDSPSQLNAQAMALSWLANTTWPGRMVGDYISTSFAGGRFVSAFALASPPSGGTYHEAIAAASVLAGVDNCAAVPNPDQADWNQDGIGDACQDSDSDSLGLNRSEQDGACPTGATSQATFRDCIEMFLGTDPGRACAATSTANDEAVDSLPADLNDDRKTNVTDRTIVSLHIKTAAYEIRSDLDGGGANNVTDRTIVALYIKQTASQPCTP